MCKTRFGSQGVILDGFFGRQKRLFASMTEIFFDDDNDGWMDNDGEFQLVLICTLSTTDRLANCLRPFDSTALSFNFRPLQPPTKILTRAIRVEVDQRNIRGADDVIWSNIHGTWAWKPGRRKN